MAEYIERESVLALTHEIHIPEVGYRHRCIDPQDVREIPAADVRPVVRGHIEEDENTYLFCSECNCNITLATYETPNGNLVLRPNFCPNCGAEMRQKEET